MKTKVTIIGLILFVQTLTAQTWTIHNWSDNYMSVAIYGEQSGVQCPDTTVTWGASYVTEVYWDYLGDVMFPQWAYSGFRSAHLDCPFWTDTSSAQGYQDVYTFTYGVGMLVNVVSGGSSTIDFQSWSISQGCRTNGGYNGWVSFTAPSPGELWIDFGSDGTVRISASQPTDWGKWDYDGSVNPSYVEPLAIIAPPKKRGKGHNK